MTEQVKGKTAPAAPAQVTVPPAVAVTQPVLQWVGPRKPNGQRAYQWGVVVVAAQGSAYPNAGAVCHAALAKLPQGTTCAQLAAAISAAGTFARGGKSAVRQAQRGGWLVAGPLAATGTTATAMPGGTVRRTTAKGKATKAPRKG